MKKAILIGLLAIFSITLFASDYVVKIMKNGEPISQDYWISWAELEEAFEATLANARSQGIELDPYFDSSNLPSEKALKVTIVPYIVDQKLVDYYAMENDLLPSESEVASETEAMLPQYTSNPETLKQIESVYGSLENFTSELRKYVYEYLKGNMVQEKVAPINEEALAKYFQENSQELKASFESIRARHILVTDEATALALKERIERGEITFGEAAMQYSIDSGSAVEGGELGYLQRGQTVPEFEEAILNAPVGKLYGPVKSDYGYHLIIVEERNEINSVQDIAANPENYSEFVNRYQNEAYGDWIENYVTENNFEYELLDGELALYDSYMKVMGDQNAATAMAVELAAKLFGPTAIENPSPEQYAVFIQLSEMLGLTNNPNYKLAIEKLYSIGEKRGLILEMVYRLKGDDPAIALDYYSFRLAELENIFSNPQLLQTQLGQYGQSFVEYVFNSIDEINNSLKALLGREMEPKTESAILDTLLRNNALAIELNFDPDWQEEKLNEKLDYLNLLKEIEPSQELETEIDATVSELEALKTPAASATEVATETASATD